MDFRFSITNFFFALFASFAAKRLPIGNWKSAI